MKRNSGFFLQVIAFVCYLRRGWRQFHDIVQSHYGAKNSLREPCPKGALEDPPYLAGDRPS